MRTPERALARKRRYRRRLRSRIILSFVLLGFGLTTLFAFATNWTRNRVENALVEDVMNRNIDEYAHRFYSNPGENPAVPGEQIRARVVKRDRFAALRIEQPVWYSLGGCSQQPSGVDKNGTPSASNLVALHTTDKRSF